MATVLEEVRLMLCAVDEDGSVFTAGEGREEQGRGKQKGVSADVGSVRDMVAFRVSDGI